MIGGHSDCFLGWGGGGLEPNPTKGPCLRVFLSIYILHSNRGIFGFFSMYYIQHCFFCRPSDSAESEDAGIEPRTVATLALAVRRSNQYRLDLILHSSSYDVCALCGAADPDVRGDGQREKAKKRNKII